MGVTGLRRNAYVLLPARVWTRLLTSLSSLFLFQAATVINSVINDCYGQFVLLAGAPAVGKTLLIVQL